MSANAALQSAAQGGGVSPAARMGWAQRLKRVFGIDVEHCQQCGGPLKIIASIDDAVVTSKILQHLQEKVDYVAAVKARGPPPDLLAGID